MTADAEDLIKELKLNKTTTDEKLSFARNFALRCLRWKKKELDLKPLKEQRPALVRFKSMLTVLPCGH